MKRIEELGISPWPWDCHKQFVTANDDGSVVAVTNVRDARLIAAAPEMYDCLCDICRRCQEDDGVDLGGYCAKCKVGIAIKKAGGEEEGGENDEHQQN